METKEELLCYCFSHSREDIEQDIRKNGRSTIMEEIISSSRAGRCHCKDLNPKGK
ncbi:MAG: (2Fe-2S)-binding protein [Proteobacteria bacterium]|nr:(2Fe-2S)-binding protein [Pseudomonadota bacterium]MBU1060053.1 (2Fe-2S)-binding protein [Pseudomonadota bacterium]